MKTSRITSFFLAAVMTLSLVFAGCGGTSSSDLSGDTVIDVGGKETLRILSGSENKELTSVLQDFADQEKINIVMDYKGSLDIMRALQADTIDYDAVWPASSIWITAGDTNHLVKHAESISVTPVVFGIKQSLAEQLGFVGKEVKVADILNAIQQGSLKFCMTSATQSNSGCCAYIGFLYALLGNPDIITSDDLQNEEMQGQMKELLSGVDRSSGSSDWLKDMFLAGDFDAVVNYECLIISANQELEKEGKEPLYVVYPEDGLSIADSPLGYIDGGDSDKEDAFLKLQEYLLSDEAQDAIQKTGRRTGYSQSVSEENKSVFNEDWGVQPDRTLSPFKMPSTDVLMEALDLYQTTFRKPSLTVYCLDYSGSMSGDGNEQLEKAMESILVQDEAEKNLLQASSDDVNIVIPFSDSPMDVWTSVGNGSEIEDMYTKIEAESPDGGTNIYYAAAKALTELENYDLDQYTPAIILMTDGQSMDYADRFQEFYTSGGYTVPIFSIMFGDADSSQLDALATLTNARVFDGREDLVGAFRAVRGYN
ncbi:MAG: VWA domain-containing protein [Eubacteriales bacterium]